MTALLLEGFGLGLSTGLYCLGACAPLFLPYLLAEGRRELGPNAWMTAQFMAGRLAAYLVFAAAVVVLGRRFAGSVPPRLVAAGLLASGALLSLYALARNAPQLPLCLPLARVLKAARLPFLFGFLVGINVCPPFLAGLLRLFSLGDVAAGLAYFAAFFAGTTLYMLPLLGAAPLARFPRLREAAALASVLSGLWFIGLGLAKLLHGA